MVGKNEEYVAFEVKSEHDEFEPEDEHDMPSVEELIKSKVHKVDGSLFEITPSREIKKWFELREF